MNETQHFYQAEALTEQADAYPKQPTQLELADYKILEVDQIRIEITNDAVNDCDE